MHGVGAAAVVNRCCWEVVIDESDASAIRHIEPVVCRDEHRPTQMMCHPDVHNLIVRICRRLRTTHISRRRSLVNPAHCTFDRYSHSLSAKTAAMS